MSFDEFWLQLLAIVAWPISIVVCVVIVRNAIREGIDEGIKKSFDKLRK